MNQAYEPSGGEEASGMTGERPDLVAFLSARIDEDEAAAKAIEDRSDPWPGQWVADGDYALRTYNGWVLAASVPTGSDFAPGVLPHIARHDPARSLRDVDAVRLIIAEYEGAFRIGGEDDEYAGGVWMGLRALAARYSDHPDYRQEWAP